jgi:hypothetical protein
MASPTQMHNVLSRSVTIEARFTASSRSNASHSDWTHLYRASNSWSRGALWKALHVQDALLEDGLVLEFLVMNDCKIPYSWPSISTLQKSLLICVFTTPDVVCKCNSVVPKCVQVTSSTWQDSNNVRKYLSTLRAVATSPATWTIASWWMSCVKNSTHRSAKCKKFQSSS